MTVPRDVPDWAPHESLREAAHAYLRDPDLALDVVLGVVAESEILAFVMERVELSAGGLWQEIACVTARQLVMWHGDDDYDDGSGEPGQFSSSVRSVSLRAIVDQGVSIGHRTVDGRRQPARVALYLATATPELSSSEIGEGTITSTSHTMETYRFSKSATDGGVLQMARLIGFARAVSRARAAAG